MNESFKTDPSQATSARAAKESGSYLCASNVTPTAVRFIVSVFLCLLCSCRMSSTQMTCSHFRKNRPKKRQKPAGCRSRIISKNRPVPIFGRSTGASLVILRCFATSATSAAALPLRDNWCVITEAAPVSKCFRCETAFSFPCWLVGLVTSYISDERWAEIALRDWEIASLSQSVELRQAASSQIVHLNIK